MLANKRASLCGYDHIRKQWALCAGLYGTPCLLSQSGAQQRCAGLLLRRAWRLRSRSWSRTV